MTAPDPPQPRTFSWRLKISLGTLSTVVAVATGMFTLRDQISPRQAGSARADVHLYERSVGDICSELNDADRARAASARRLARQLRSAKTTTAQRDALLDSTRAILAPSEDGLARFEALEIPSAQRARHRTTDRAWTDIVREQRAYAQRLDLVSSPRELLKAVDTLPRMRTALSRDTVRRAAGLIQLGGGSCRLEPAIVTPTITLPGTYRTVTPRSGLVSPRAPNPSGPVRSASVHPLPGVAPDSGVTPSVSLSPAPAVDQPVARTVDPPAAVAPPRDTGASTSGEPAGTTVAPSASSPVGASPSDGE